MSILGRLFRGASPAASPTALAQPATPQLRSVSATLYTGHETLEVVGESHYQDALWEAIGGFRTDYVREEAVAVLLPDSDNPHDPNAVEVLINLKLVGYLSRGDAVAYLPGLIRLMEQSPTGFVALGGVICGGGPRDDADVGFLGVFLDHDPADFGLAPHLNSHAGFRTGLSEAIATDLADDSYDLSWLNTLSGNDVTGIKQLRNLLKTEEEPIDRHYMLCELERRLYKSRDAFGSALDEFDEACRQHDAEMITIRPALFDKFGVIPELDTYRQAAIRCQKAKDWTAVRDWAERGIAVYGDAADRQGAVDDLHKRLHHAEAKLEATRRPITTKPRTVTAPSAVEIETLVCGSCGTSFERARTRGRKPHDCPACRGLAAVPSAP